MIDRENEITERQCGRDVESRKKKWGFFSVFNCSALVRLCPL